MGKRPVFQTADEFKAVHSASENAIYDAIHAADLLDALWVPEMQPSEYLADTVEFIDWWEINPEPFFDEVVMELTDIFASPDGIDPEESDIRQLAGEICSIIYDQEKQVM